MVRTRKQWETLLKTNPRDCIDQIMHLQRELHGYQETHAGLLGMTEELSSVIQTESLIITQRRDECVKNTQEMTELITKLDDELKRVRMRELHTPDFGNVSLESTPVRRQPEIAIPDYKAVLEVAALVSNHSVTRTHRTKWFSRHSNEIVKREEQTSTSYFRESYSLSPTESSWQIRVSQLEEFMQSLLESSIGVTHSLVQSKIVRLGEQIDYLTQRFELLSVRLNEITEDLESEQLWRAQLTEKLFHVSLECRFSKTHGMFNVNEFVTFLERNIHAI